MNVATATHADIHAEPIARAAGARAPNAETGIGSALQVAASAAAALDDPDEQARFTRWVVGADGERLGESALQLSGMHCAACAGLIENALLAVPGVRWARVAAASQRATVGWDPARTAPARFMAAVQAAGYGAVPDAAAPARALRRQEYRQALWRLFVASFCAMQVMMLATPSYVASGSDLAPDMRQLLNWGSWILSLPVLAFSAGPFFASAWRALTQRQIGMDVPVTLGVVITFVASTGATFDPGGLFGHEVYFDSLTMFVSFLLGARFLEMRARHRAAEALEASLARMPESAERVNEDGSITTVSVLRLMPGDLVRVALGQAVPADGVLVDGATACDEALLTGESTPVPKQTGADLVGGSVNVGAPVLMRVQRVGADTRFEAIVSMMRSAATQRPALARLADRWAAPFLWVVLALAALAAAAWSVIDPARAVWVAVSVLIVTCPCALSLAAPAVLVAATRALAQRGVLVQRLDAIEALARVEHVFVDKTGTLTTKALTLSAVRLTADGAAALRDETGARAMAAALANWSAHPLSRAIAEAAAEGTVGSTRGAGRPDMVLHDVVEHPGLGVSARDTEGRTWRLGASAWAAPGAAAAGEARVWLSRQHVALAGFEFAEVLREDAQRSVAALQAEGLHVTMLSGDSAPQAEALARQLALRDVVAQATPAEKLAAVKAAQQRGERVAMIGDGVNDAPVLAQADVSLAMGQGALVSRAQADAVVNSGRLWDVVLARRTARRALRIVHQNLAWAAAYNTVCIPLALAGWLPPWAAGLGMACSSLFVVLNALRIARPAA